jgi:hypothetical protein
METTTPKRLKSKGYDPGIFDHVLSVKDFAEALGVPEKTIPLIIPLTEGCKNTECPFNAIASNNGFCPVHCHC